jgi:hypothetical protein
MHAEFWSENLKEDTSSATEEDNMKVELNK